ncbi:MAG: histidinol-phosphatase [Ruminococcaceae bacterium]|nr:histidinol-phosphatase [Oscillospiraceae bacterium]
MKLIDFHAHFLPRLDHGSRSSQVSLSQLSLMQAAGVDTACATSHFYPQEVLAKSFLEARNAAFDRLLEVLGDTPRPRIVLGAEVLICEGLDQMEDLEELCLEGTNVMLLEMPFSAGAWTGRLFRTVSEIADRGIKPVFAHVDRYPPKLVEQLFDMGLTAQLNADSLNHFFKPKHLTRWIEEGQIVALGSDLHGCAEDAYLPYTKVCLSLKERTNQIMAETEALLASAVRR